MQNLLEENERISHMFYSVTYAESKLWLDPWSLLHIMIDTHTHAHAYIHKWSSCGWAFIEEYEGDSLDRGERIGNRNEGLFAFKKIASKSHEIYAIGSISTSGLVQRYLILYFHRTTRASRFKRLHRGIIKRSRQ